ncbi:hypothetical protein BpHYR1_032124 [Brachionus plicatilis]|uniref:SMARCC N-terminal domain-containing protein n=1 Tax=Brachionus plicatilis TaxID=10195 RepID=A0A3M7PKW5_BRAPC|nr:hypothetical protein BpHYR1_032124 [Brachionus plicatilis]
MMITSSTNSSTSSSLSNQLNQTNQMLNQQFNKSIDNNLISTSTTLQQFDTIRKWLSKHHKKLFESEPPSNKALSQFLCHKFESIQVAKEIQDYLSYKGNNKRFKNPFDHLIYNTSDNN